jgi:hypothetical protein
MKTLIVGAIILILFGISSSAEEIRHEVTVQGSGFFKKQTTVGGVTDEATNSGGLMAGYRFNLKNCLRSKVTTTISEMIRSSRRAAAPHSYR